MNSTTSISPNSELQKLRLENQVLRLGKEKLSDEKFRVTSLLVGIICTWVSFKAFEATLDHSRIWSSRQHEFDKRIDEALIYSGNVVAGFFGIIGLGGLVVAGVLGSAVEETENKLNSLKVQQNPKEAQHSPQETQNNETQKSE